MNPWDPEFGKGATEGRYMSEKPWGSQTPWELPLWEFVAFVIACSLMVFVTVFILFNIFG